MEILVSGFLIFFSGFLASSEVALFSLSRSQLRGLREKFRPTYRKVKTLLNDPSGLLLTVLLINELVNIILSTLVSLMISRNWSAYQYTWIGKFTAIATRGFPEWTQKALFGVILTAPIVLILCEITPKVIGARTNQLVSILGSPILHWIYLAFSPARSFFRKTTKILGSFFGKQVQGTSHTSAEKAPWQPVIGEEDFLSMAEEGIQEGTVRPAELELIRNVFRLDDQRVSDIFTPLHQTYSISADMKTSDCLQWIKTVPRFSRYPVYEKSKDRLIGILHTKDLLISRLEPEQNSWPIRKLTKKPFLVSPKMRINTLFLRLKQKKSHFAIVEESSGRSVGVVTLQDVLDALFEDAFPETEEFPPDL